MKLLIWIFFTHLFNAGQTYKILGIFPFAGHSHYLMYEMLMKALSEKGHTVDVVSHFPQKTSIPRFNDVSLRGCMDVFLNNVPVSLVQSEHSCRLSTINFMVNHIGLDICKQTFNTTFMKKLKYTKKKYDLIITELFTTDCMLGFGYIFKTPVIAISSSVNLPWANHRFGNPDNPSYIPNYYTPYARLLTLVERLDNTITQTVSKIWHFFGSYHHTKTARLFFGNELPSLEELAANTSLILVNSHFSINGIRPTVPAVVEVGGLHIPPLKVISKNFEDVLNITGMPQYKGVIFFTLGSMVLTETLPQEKLVAFFNAFKELPYKILWKANKDKLPDNLDVPPNIHFEQWMPQFDILCHPNMKLYISHGGLMGLQEAVFCGIPTIGIPLFADQALNLNALETLGASIKINYEDISRTTVLGACKKVLYDSKYQENARIISERFKDRPMTPLATAIYWVEYICKHKGAPHLRSTAIDLRWYEYYLLDVGVILLLGVVLVLYVTYLILIIFMKFLFKLPILKSKYD